MLRGRPARESRSIAIVLVHHLGDLRSKRIVFASDTHDLSFDRIKPGQPILELAG